MPESDAVRAFIQEPLNVNSRTPLFVTTIFATCLLATSYQVRRITKVFQPNEVLLDAAHTHEAVEDRDAARFIVCSACPATTEWLLAHDRPCTFFVVVHVTGGVTEFVGCLDQSLALGSKARKFRADKLSTKG